MPDEDPFDNLAIFAAGMGSKPGTVAFTIDDTSYATTWRDAIRLATMMLVQAMISAASADTTPEVVHDMFVLSLQEMWEQVADSNLDDDDEE